MSHVRGHHTAKKSLHTANRITKSSGQYHKPYTVQCLQLPGTHSCSFIQTEGVIQQIGFVGAYAAQVVPRKFASCSRTKSSEKLSHHQLAGFHHQLAGFHHQLAGFHHQLAGFSLSGFRLVLFPVLEGGFFAARFLNMLGVVTGYWYFASFVLVGFDVAFQDAQTPQTVRSMS